MDLVRTGGQTVIGDINATGAFHIRDVSGSFPCGGNKFRTICDDATLVSVSPQSKHTFILLVRMGMFELYVDEMLVQSYTYGTYPVTSGKIGVAINGTAGSTVQFNNVTASAWSRAQ